MHRDTPLGMCGAHEVAHEVAAIARVSSFVLKCLGQVVKMLFIFGLILIYLFDLDPLGLPAPHRSASKHPNPTRDSGC